MASAGLEPVIIEDLVKFGEDRGRAEGRAEGLRAAVTAVTAVCKVLGITLGPKRRAQVEAMTAAELEALCSALTQQRRSPGRSTR